MIQPQKISHEFQQDVATMKVFHHKRFALYGILVYLMCPLSHFVYGDTRRLNSQQIYRPAYLIGSPVLSHSQLIWSEEFYLYYKWLECTTMTRSA